MMIEFRFYCMNKMILILPLDLTLDYRSVLSAFYRVFVDVLQQKIPMRS